MKTFTKKLLKNFTVLAGIALLPAVSHATTYTAVASGNYSSTATWSGGTVPPSTLTADQVIIPSGINVVLDQNQTVNGTLSTFTVNGMLTSSTSVSNSLMLTLGSLSGSGTVTLDSMVMQLSNGFAFSGTLVAHNFTSMGATMASTANITVTNHLWLNGGILNLASGNLSLSSGATIIVSGGSMSTSGGVLGLTNNYNVMYTGSASATTGLELSGNGLRKIMLNMSGSAGVTLSSDLMVMDTMMLNSGTLMLNNHNLTFSGNGNFSGSGTGTISAGNNSDITINSSNSFAGGLRFTTGSNTVHNFTLNSSNSGRTFALASDLMINGMLSLQSGTMDATGHMVTINSAGSVSGGSSNSYIITGMNGSLEMNLTAGNSNTYHIGTMSHYAPAVIMANSGSASSMVGVAADANVYAQGTTGTMLSTDQPLVGNTWFVHSSTSSNLNLGMQLMWSGNMEMNSFDHANAYLSHYTNGAWDAGTVSAATTASNGMYMMSRSNITSLSPFAVMGKNAVTTSVGNVIAANSDITLYPNPVTNVLNIETGKTALVKQVTMFDIAGHLVKTIQISGTAAAVPVNDIPAGIYTVRFTGDNYNAVQKFVKQ